MQSAKKDLLQYNSDALATELSEHGLKKFQCRQIEEWLWKHGVRSFDEMTNISKSLRQQLSEHYSLPSLHCDVQQKSIDGTIKFRFRLHDGLHIESVLIPVPENERYTICLSSQAGCSLSCRFCATGKMGLLRQLTASEIFDQYMFINRINEQLYHKPVSNIVYMGMGEPLLNYRQVFDSIQRLTSPSGPYLSARRITISTAGIAKMIKKLADDGIKVNLALSLHAADDTKRNQIMPINETNNLKALMEALKYFYKKTGNRISYEYIAFDGFNDSLTDAKNLVRLCSHFPVRVNIIEYNPIDGVDFTKSKEDRINAFAREVRRHGIMITLRRSRGQDIDAACGQLANKA